MLDSITSAHFLAVSHKSCWIETADGDLELTIEWIKENPNATLPGARCTAFTVLFRGPETPSFRDGIGNLRTDGPDGWRLEGVFLNRVMPPPGNPPGAYYQLIINA